MRKVRVGHRDFAIEPFPTGFGERLFGETDYNTLTIRVHQDLAPSVRSSTLLHEILHVIYDEYGLAKDDTKERVVTMMSNGLCQVLRDNPDVVSFILGGLKK
jgi:hypothetical protein